MAFGTTDIVGYMSSMELGTIQNLMDNVNTGTYGIGGGKCLYGRYGGVPGTIELDRPASSKDPFETSGLGYSCTGYGSPQALYYMFRRCTDPVLKETALKWHAGWTRHAMQTTIQNLIKWGIPPGEYTQHEPLQPLNAFSNGDTDPHRHVDCFGHCQVLCDENMKIRGGWSSAEAVNFAAAWWGWLRGQGGGRSHPFTRQNPREYLRVGNPINSLCGIADVARYYGYTTWADDVLDDAVAIMYLYFQDANAYDMVNGTYTFKCWNYGTRNDDGDPPFPYGFSEYTMQPWYENHIMIGLYNLAVRTLQRATSAAYVDPATAESEYGSASLTSTGSWSLAFNRCMHIIEKQTDLYSFDLRAHAPTGDLSAHEAGDFVNAKMQGFKFGTSTGEHIESATDPGLMTIANWHDLTESADYYRAQVLERHEVDGEYFRLYYTTTAGSNEFERNHYPVKNASKGYTTDSPGLAPATEAWGAAGHNVPDMMYMRWLLGEASAKDWGLVTWFDYAAYSNSSDRLRMKSERIPSSEGWPDTGSGISRWERHWHWVVQCGHLWRNFYLGWGDTEF